MRLDASSASTQSGFAQAVANNPEKLFNQEKEIPHAELVFSKDGNGQSICTCRVEFQFPSSSSSREGCRTCQLPPSVHISNSGWSIRSEYFLKLTVERNILGRLTKSASIRRDLQFVCSSHNVPRVVPSPTRFFVPRGPTSRAAISAT